MFLKSSCCNVMKWKRCILILFLLISIEHTANGQCNVNAGQDVSICFGSSKILNATVTGIDPSLVQFSWTPTDGLNNSTIANPEAKPLVTTNYTVTAKYGACNISDDVTVSVNAPPVVDFSFTNNSTCSGTAVLFTSQITGTGPYTYTWNFGDSTTPVTTQNATHSFVSLGCGIGSFNVTLTVTDANGCSAVMSHQISVIQKPDIDFKDVENPFDPFSNCNNASASHPIYSITVGNSSASPCVNSYSIDWGDGSTQANISFPLSHTYNTLGAFDMVITAVGNNGCTNSKRYVVKNVSNPSGGISSPGSTTNLCAPTEELQFEISKWGTNSPGTIYDIDYGDGSSHVILTHESLVASSYYNAASPTDSRNYPVPHSYTKTSCVTDTKLFTVILKVINACGETTGTVSNISILKKPTAKFSAPVNSCVNKTINFINLTDPGFTVNCSTNAIYTWDFGDGSPIVSTPPQSAQNISHQYLTPGNYIVTLTSQSLCGLTSFTQTICIEPPLTPTFTVSPNEGCAPLIMSLTNTTDLSQFCSPAIFWWQISYTKNDCDIAADLDYVNGTGSNSQNPFIIFKNSGIYTIKLMLTNSCGSFFSTKTVTIKKPPIVAINNISTVCQTFPNTSISPVAIISDCSSGSLSYQWSFPGGNPSTSTSLNPGPIIYDTPGTYPVSLTVISDCGTRTADMSFTINPTPTIDNDLVDQSKCKENSSDPVHFSAILANTVFNWTNSNPGIGIPSSGTGDIPSYTLKNTKNVVQTAVFTVTPKITATNCVGAAKTFKINVNPLPTVNSIGNITLCNNATQPDIPISGTVAGTVFKWTNSSPEIGLPSEGTGNIPSFKALNPGSTPIIATISITPTINECPGTIRTFTITVNPSPDDLIVTDKEFCNGVNTGSISFSSSVAATTYSWTNSNTSIGLTNSSGTGNISSFVAKNTGNTPISSIISVTPKANNCIGQIKSFNITVNPSAIVQFSRPDQTICTGTSTEIVNLTSPTAGVTFSWTAVIPNGITGAQTSGSNSIPVQELVNTTSGSLSIIYKAKAVLPGAAVCEGAEFIYTTVVNPRPRIQDVTIAVCSGEGIILTPANGNGNIVPTGTTYTWSDPVITPSSEALSGAAIENTPQGKFSQVLTNNLNETVSAVYTLTPVFSACAGDPFKITVNVKPVPTVDNIQDFIFCSGQQFPGIAFHGAVTGTVFSWTFDHNIGLETSGTGDLPAFTLVNPGNSPVVASVRVTPSSNGCTGIPKTFKITVNPIPDLSNPVKTKSICSGVNTAISLLSNVTGTSFSWTARGSSANVSGFGINGNGNTINETLVNSGKTPETVTYSITPLANNCNGLTVDYLVTVQPVAAVINLPGDQTICSGAAYAAVPLSADVSGSTFRWEVSAPAAISGFAPNGTGVIIPGGTIQSTSSKIEVITYTIYPIAGGCEGNPSVYKITVNPGPRVTNILNQTLCSGGKSVPVTLTSNIEGVTFTWNVSPVPVSNITGYKASGTNLLDEQILFNSGNTPEIVNYHIIPTSDLGLSCSGTPADYVITVNPLPRALATAPSQTICSGETAGIQLTSSLPNTTFTWSIESADASVSGATGGTGPKISQTLNNNSQEPGSVKYKILPMVGTCSGEAIYAEVLVNPRPLPVILGENSICVGTTGEVYQTASNGTGYIWVLSSGGVITEGQGTAQIKVNWSTTGNHNLTVNYKNQYSCDATLPGILNVNVHPILPVSLSISPDKNSICPGTPVTFTANPVNGGSTPLYQWKVNGVGVGDEQPSFSYSPKDGDVVQCQLLSNAACPSGNPALSNTVTMVVYSDLPAQISISGNSDNICPGESASFIATPFNEGINPFYQWFVNGKKTGSNQPSFQYEPVNGDLVQCKMVSGNSCSSNGTVLSNVIRMNVAPPALMPAFTIEITKDCAPVKVHFRNNSPSGGVAYNWDFGDGNTFTSPTPVDVYHTYENFSSAAKVFTVSLTVVTRFTHCFNVVSKQITVGPELFAGSPVEYTGCSPFVHKFENAYPGAKSYQWIDSKGQILSTAIQPTLSFSAANKRDSVHTVYLVAESLTGCLDTIVNTIKVSPALEMPSFTYTGNPDCLSVKFLFQNTSPEGADLFIWNFNDGTINTTYHSNETVSHTFYNGTDVPLSFDVTLTSSNGSYCSLSKTQKVLLEPEYTAGFPVTFQGCSPLTREFYNAYGGAGSYQWVNAKGKLLSTDQKPVLTFLAPIGRDSIHLIYLITESMSGCRDTIVNKVMVYSADKTQFSALPLEGCSPLAVQFTGSSSPEVVNYQWNFGDGSDLSILKDPKHIFIDPNGAEQSYTIALVGTNQYGCADTSFQKIHLLPTPQVNFTAVPDLQTYPNRTIQISNLTPNGDWIYTWNLGDQKPPVTGALSSYSFDLPGEYVITLTAKGSQCENVIRKKVVINPGTPLAQFEPDSSGCAPLVVKFRNYSKNGSLYSWDFGNGSQSVDFEPSVIYYDAGTFPVTLKVYNQFGEMSVSQKIITVYPVPQAHFKPLPFKVKIPGQTVTFFNNSVNAAAYLWDFGDGNSSREAEPVHQYLESGLFDVTLYVTSSENCKDTLKLAAAVEAFSDGLKVPNAFIPSKDGPNGGSYVPGDPANHVFYPAVASGDVISYELLIYNRWGNLVFRSQEVGRGWDGYYKDRLCPQDVYVWKIRCTFKSGNTVTKTGDVTLIQ